MSRVVKNLKKNALALGFDLIAQPTAPEYISWERTPWAMLAILVLQAICLVNRKFAGGTNLTIGPSF